MNTTWPTLWSVMLSARSREHAEALARDIERLLRETNHQAYHAVIVRHSPPELVALRKAAVPSGHGPAGGHEAIAQDLDKIPPGLSWHPGQPPMVAEAATDVEPPQTSAPERPDPAVGQPTRRGDLPAIAVGVAIALLVAKLFGWM